MKYILVMSNFTRAVQSGMQNWVYRYILPGKTLIQKKKKKKVLLKLLVTVLNNKCAKLRKNVQNNFINGFL